MRESEAVVGAPADPTRRFKHETLAFLAGLVDVTGAVFYSVDRDLNAVDHAFHHVSTAPLRAEPPHRAHHRGGDAAAHARALAVLS
jgi:hypothetical protein